MTTEGMRRAIGHYPTLEKTAWRVAARVPGLRFDVALAAFNRFAQQSGHLYVLQIGANDGVLHDPLHQHILRQGWRGALIEPLPNIYERLVANYDGVGGLTFVNAAIGDNDGDATFYYIQPEPGDPPWSHQIGSLERDHLLSHEKWIPNIASRVVSTTVPVMTIESLLRDLGDPQVDLVHIDAERRDLSILHQLLARKPVPSAILYEQLFISRADRKILARRFAELGYHVASGRADSFAERRSTTPG
jgi:FkbM family methyltransferase